MSSVTLGAASGAVLIDSSPRGSPPPTTTPPSTTSPTTTSPTPSATASSRPLSPNIDLVIKLERRKNLITVSGHVLNASAEQISVTIQRLRSGRWVVATVKQAAIAANGSFQTAARGLPRGRYRASARFLGGEQASDTARSFRVG